MCEQCSARSRSHLSRRRVLGAVSAALAIAAAGPAPPSQIHGDDALTLLMRGNARYVANTTHMRDFAAGRAARVATHRPIASILGCSDARVGPEFVFDQGPGDLFVVRVAGNVLEDEGLASLEYAAQFLGSPLIFVLGHSNCGAVEAALKVVQDNTVLPGHLPELVDQIKPAIIAAQQTHPADLLAAAIMQNVRRTMQRVTDAKPLLAAMVAGGNVKVAGGVYNIATGKVSLI